MNTSSDALMKERQTTDVLVLSVELQDVIV
jgi:hypothetical protein